MPGRTPDQNSKGGLKRRQQGGLKRRQQLSYRITVIKELFPASWHYLFDGSCAAYRSPLATRCNTCGYPHRINLPVVTSQPLRPPLYHYQSFTGHGSPDSQRFTSA
ncbi:hypothetical protein ElyMa_005285900 [Elysia marginata]|uniref:Uncharacterized protein n=1 Tax=Elysia marginata TaxID=1093978 RepID=A0AAV4JY26_9GAST|nr:hypothetical protein ElyMa_005285900 [Elysia marginata]